MATITTAIKVQDGMTQAFKSMSTAMNVVLNTFESIQMASGETVDTASIQFAREELAKVNVEAMELQDNLSKISSTPVSMQVNTPNQINNQDLYNDTISRNQTSNNLINSITCQQQYNQILEESANELARMRQIATDIANVTGEDKNLLMANNSEYQKIAELQSLLLQNEQEIQANIAKQSSQWQSVTNIQVFTNTGIERYKQEISSANNMINQLAQSQQRIQAQARGMDILPNNAINDINALNNRINGLKIALEQVQAKNLSSIGADKASSQVEVLRQQLNNTIQSQNELTQAMNKMDIDAINNAYIELANNINNAEINMREFNNSVNSGITSSNNLMQTLMQFSFIQEAINLVTGQVSSAIERLDTINNYPKVMSNLGISTEQSEASMNMLSEKLKGLPTTLDAAVSSVQKFTAVNGNIGASTRMFLALNNAILAGGGSTQVQQSALEQLSQAYAKGKPDTQEWRSAMTAMPAQLTQVANAMGYVNANALGEALRNGKESMNNFMITLIQLNEEGINGFQSFEEQARNATGGFATSIENMKTAVTRGITKVITSINNSLEKAGLPSLQEMIVNTGTEIENLLNDVGTGIEVIMSVLSPLIDLIKPIGEFVSNNWSIIEPIINGVLIALGLIVLAYGAYTAATKISTIAQNIFNSSLLACPITWIIIGIIALIAIIYAVVAACNKWTNSTVSATGIVLGALNVFVSNLYNTFFVPVWNAIASLVNFFANCFKNPVKSVEILFAEMAKNVLTTIHSLIKGIEDLVNKIPGVQVNLTSGFTNLLSDIEGYIIDAKAEMGWEDVMEYKTPKDVWKAFDEGYAKGEEIDGKVSETIKDYKSLLDELNNNVNTTADNTGSIADSLDIAEEDLQYLRDIAERDVINRFTTAEIKVEMNNNNNINSELDIDGIVDSLGEKLEERLEVVAERCLCIM